MSRLPQQGQACSLLVELFAPEEEISLLMVLAEVLVLTLMALATGLSLPELITVISWMEGSDWSGAGHMSPLGLGENGISPSPTTDLRVGDRFCLTGESKCSYQKKGQVLFRQKAAVPSSSLPHLTTSESTHVLLLFFLICGDFVQVWCRGLVPLWRISWCLYKEKKDMWGCWGSREKDDRK